MAIDTLLLLLLLAAVVILIMRQMRAKGGTGDAEAFAELRGRLGRRDEAELRTDRAKLRRVEPRKVLRERARRGDVGEVGERKVL